MRILGILSEQESRDPGRLPPFLPACHFYECHQSAPIYAAPNAILDAVAAYDMRSDRLSHLFMTLRELPGKCLPRHRLPPDAQETFGLQTFTLLDRQSDRLTYGLTGRFWRPDMGIIPLRDAEAFTAFHQPGVARLVLHFQLLAEGDAWRLRTETFIYCPDNACRLKLLPYWLLIRAASGIIRRRTLAAIQRQFTATS